MNTNEHQCEAPAGSIHGKATRRDFLQGSLVVAGSLLASSVAPHDLLAESGTKRPNLVFFLGEGQRADALSIAGNPILKTPNHDRIGREGMRFENAFCTNALCAPARAVALSGMYSRSTGALSNEHLNDPYALRHSALHRHSSRSRLRGCDPRQGACCRTVSKNATGITTSDTTILPITTPIPFFKEGRKGKIGPEKQYRNVYPDDLTVDRALAWLEEDRGDKPFCLLVWFVAPHEPFFRPRRHLDLYRGVR